MSRKECWRAILVCSVLCLGTIALYSPAFTFGFVNPEENYGASNWHPLAWLSHRVDYRIFGAGAGGHHATSLVLHALNSVLVFLVLRRMTGAFWRSAAVAAFFAWHPLHVESVAWIAERKDVLGGFFWLLAIMAYLKYAENSKSANPNSKLFYFLALLFFGLGLMAEPTLVTLPCILLLIDWWPLGRLRFCAATENQAKAPATPRISFLLIEKIPFVLLSVAFGVIAVVAKRHEAAATAAAGVPFKARFISAGVSYFRYLEETVWPEDLGPTYPSALHFPHWQLAGIALVLVGISVLAIYLRKSRRYWLVGWLWFLGMLVPTLNLMFTGAQPMADRYMYLPSIGLFILICWDAADLAGQAPLGRTVLGIVCGLALAGCCIASSLQLQYWRNEGTILSRIVQPESNFIGHANYARFLVRRNRLPEAQAECEKAVNILPAYAPLRAELGGIFLVEGKFDDAIGQYAAVQKLDPGMAGIHLPWGRALLAEKRLDAAASEFKTVISAEPGNFEAHDFLGETLAISGKTGAAIEEFRHSLALQPNQADLLNNLAWILATDPRPQIRNGPDAVKFATRACALTHDTQPAFIGTLAAAYAEDRRFDDAVGAAQKAHDIAAAQAATAQKSNESPAARSLQSLAARNLQLADLYRSHQPFHETQAR